MMIKRMGRAAPTLAARPWRAGTAAHWPRRQLSFAQPQVAMAGDSGKVVITPGVDKDGLPLPPATAVCFFLHGLGDNAMSFTGMFHQLAITLPHVKFVLPTAKKMKVTVNGGMLTLAGRAAHERPLRACCAIVARAEFGRPTGAVAGCNTLPQSGPGLIGGAPRHNALQPGCRGQGIPWPISRCRGLRRAGA